MFLGLFSCHTYSLYMYRITIFATDATQLGFFLVMEHFSSLAILSPEDPIRPCEAVIASVCLWGCHLSLPNSPFRDIEDLILKVALYQRSITLIDGELNPRRILQSVQAEVLLSCYFYRRGILIEAMNHAATAASFVTASGMHGMLSMEQQPPRELEVLADGRASYLPAPRNVPETGELIDGFWSVYIVANQLAFASTTAICADVFDAPHLLIGCPWPLHEAVYRDVCSYHRC